MLLARRLLMVPSATGIEFVAATSAFATSGASVVIPVPSHSAGDMLIVRLGSRDNGGQTWTAPAGWTELFNADALGHNAETDPAVFYRVAGGSEPSNYTFTMSNGKDPFGGVMLSYSGVSAVTWSSEYTLGSAITSARDTTMSFSSGSVGLAMLSAYEKSEITRTYTFTNGTIAGAERIEAVGGNGDMVFNVTEFDNPATTFSRLTLDVYSDIEYHAITHIYLHP